MTLKPQLEDSVESVALIFQPMLVEARRLAEQCSKMVEAAGFFPKMLSAWELSPQIDSSDVRMAVTFGGDGTIIRASRWLAGTGVPILGIAMGKLGFLSELSPDAVKDRFPSILAGNYWLDERLMLSAKMDSDEDATGGESAAGRPNGGGSRSVDTRMIALNDVVIARGASPRVVQLDVSVDGVHLVRYVADGLIVATPTGSTAYALAAGGPVVAPGAEGLVVVPVAAHLSALRSLVVPLLARVEVRATAEHPAQLVLDGQVQIPVRNEQKIVVEIAKERTFFARTGKPGRFYETLVESLKKR